MGRRDTTISDEQARRYGQEAGPGRLYGANAPDERKDPHYGRRAYSSTTGNTYGEPMSDETAGSVARRDIPFDDADSWAAHEGEVDFRMVGGWPLGVIRNKRGPMDRFSGGPISGIGPLRYKPRDKRVAEDVADRLTRHGFLDAEEIDVEVDNGEVTLLGLVPDRHMVRLAEDVAASVHGVKGVKNRLRTRSPSNQGQTQEEMPDVAPRGR